MKDPYKKGTKKIGAKKKRKGREDRSL